MQAQASACSPIKPARGNHARSVAPRQRTGTVSATRMALQVERWDEKKHGKLSSGTMLKRLAAEGYSGSTYQFPPGTQFGYHTHNCDKKDSIITGQFKFVSRDQGEVTLEPGDVLYVPKGMEHKAETIGTETVTFVDASK